MHVLRNLVPIFLFLLIFGTFFYITGCNQGPRSFTQMESDLEEDPFTTGIRNDLGQPYTVDGDPFQHDKEAITNDPENPEARNLALSQAIQSISLSRKDALGNIMPVRVNAKGVIEKDRPVKFTVEILLKEEAWSAPASIRFNGNFMPQVDQLTILRLKASNSEYYELEATCSDRSCLENIKYTLYRLKKTGETFSPDGFVPISSKAFVGKVSVKVNRFQKVEEYSETSRRRVEALKSTTEAFVQTWKAPGGRSKRRVVFLRAPKSPAEVPESPTPTSESPTPQATGGVDSGTRPENPTVEVPVYREPVWIISGENTRTNEVAGTDLETVFVVEPTEVGSNDEVSLIELRPTLSGNAEESGSQRYFVPITSPEDGPDKEPLELRIEVEAPEVPRDLMTIRGDKPTDSMGPVEPIDPIEAPEGLIGLTERSFIQVPGYGHEDFPATTDIVNGFEGTLNVPDFYKDGVKVPNVRHWIKYYSKGTGSGKNKDMAGVRQMQAFMKFYQPVQNLIQAIYQRWDVPAILSYKYPRESPKYFGGCLGESCKNQVEPYKIEWAGKEGENSLGPDQIWLPTARRFKMTVAPAKFENDASDERRYLSTSACAMAQYYHEIYDYLGATDGIGALIIIAYNQGEGTVRKWVRRAVAFGDDYTAVVKYHEARAEAIEYGNQVLGRYFVGGDPKRWGLKVPKAYHNQMPHNAFKSGTITTRNWGACRDAIQDAGIAI